MTDPIWRLRIFGEPGLEGPAGPVAVRTQRQLGVLLYLALEGPSARRDKVVPLFWPGVPEQKGRHSLTQAMSDLRRTMPGLVQVDRTHVSVCGAQTDLAYLTEDPWSIERGDILAGMDALGGMDLAQWLDAARERVRRTAVRELESMLHRFEAQERVRLARAMLRLDPACETAAIAVAEEALDRGQVTEAARYLQAHQNHITAELGFDPQLRVASLLKRLERGDLARARAAILGESLQLRAPETVIVGRDAELEVLAEGWRDAAAGRGRTIRLSGAAGIGKSALVRHFLATLAGRGHAAFFVTCHQATRSVPFALVADLTDAISGDSGFAGSDPQWLAELSRIHPVLRRQFPGIPVPEPAPPESIRERLTESLTVILETIADGNPIALAIDDADQADQASLSVLHLVRRRTKRHAVLTLLTSADAGRPAEEHALESDRHLLLQPIQRSAIMELLRSRVPEDGDAGVLERIADIAGGNPLYALTLLGDQSLRQSVAREGLYTSTWTPPRDLLDAVSRAVVQHSTLARRVLSALAVAGTPSTVNLVSEVAGLSEADVRAAAVELLANDRIRITGEEMELASPLWQSAIYALENDGVRTYLHHCWATALDGVAAIPPHTRLPRVARHLAKARLHQLAVIGFENGAIAALATGAAQEASSILTESAAIQEPVGARTWYLQTRASFEQGKYDAALESLDHIEGTAVGLTAIELLDARFLRLDALHRLRRVSAVTLRKDLLTLLDQPNLSGPLHLRALQLRAELAREDGCAPELHDVWTTIAGLNPTNALEEAHSALTRGFVRWQQGLFHESRRDLVHACATFSRLHLLQDAARAANGAGITSMAAGHWHSTFDCFRDGVLIAMRLGDIDMGAALMSNAGLAAEDLGFMEEAIKYDSRAIEFARRAGTLRRAVVTTLNLADVMLVDGQIAEASALLAEAERLATHEGGDGHFQVQIRFIDLMLVNRDYHKAEQLLLNVLEMTEARKLDTFLRPRLLRQAYTVSQATGRHPKGLASIEIGGCWTVYGRCEVALVNAFCYMARSRDSSKIIRAAALAERYCSLMPIRWIVATGLKDLCIGNDEDSENSELIESATARGATVPRPESLDELTNLIEHWQQR